MYYFYMRIYWPIAKLKFILTVSVFAIFLTFLSSQTTNAASNPADTNVRSYIYTKAFLECGSNNKAWPLYVDKLQQGYYFSTGDTTIGFMYNAGQGVGCSDNKADSWVYTALKLWNLDPNAIIENLCAFGLTRSNNCISGPEKYFHFPSSEDFQKSFLTKINSTFYKKSGSNMPSLSDAEMYLLYYKSLVGGGAKFKVAYTEATALEKELVSDCPGSGNCDKSYLIWDVNNENKAYQAIYSDADKGRGEEISLFEGERKKMEDIAKFLTKDRAEAYASYLKANNLTPASAGSTSTGTSDSKTSCSIPAIGWLLCPIFNSLAGIADASYGFISKQFLEVSPGLFITSENSDQKSAAAALNNAWSTFRNVANIGLVIAFIIIIISQLTGFGISNYGIKKMLPRLVMVIILINLSYIIVQGAIDISNILGSSIYDSFNALASQMGGGVDIVKKPGWVSITEDVLSGTLVAGAAAAVLWGAVGALLPVLLAAVVGLLMIFFILVLRQVVIILLIVLAPLAFLAYLLPNTEKLFTQWRKTLTAVLIIYPICSLVFGASAFASELLKLVYK